MTPQKVTSLDEIVRQAQTLSPDEQVQFIRNACKQDRGLISTAMSRLTSGDDSWHGPVSDGDCPANPSDQEDLTGQMIGPYRVLRSLGQGGMGEVFLAERADAQFEQQVAIKLVRRGLLSRHVQGRLRLERQILATLDHPNIARLLDGGNTRDGTPYIVMEYVDGEPIDLYCDRRGLPIKERLGLFLTICSAVHRAHQNLIVHRDLKPSNILVTKQGAVKLLDFGIAKLLDVRQMTHTLAVTHADIRMMTPDHASPEQIKGEPITTASDIYVLGVLLYELVTGYRPFGRKGHRLADLETAICDETPLAPSAAVAHGAAADNSIAVQIASERSSTPPRLKRELRGDLDNIVLMAMRKEPDRRYSSVEQFAADIKRYLDGMPIIARADAWIYRSRKFVSRHALSVGASAAFVAILIGFAATTFLQSKRIAQERDLAALQRARAESENDRSEAVSSFLVGLFQQSDPSQARGNQVTAREILDKGAQRVSAELKLQPDLQAAMLNTIGRVYFSLGLTSEARPLIERGLAIRREHGDLTGVAESLLSLDEVLIETGELQRAEQLVREALAIYGKETAEDSEESGRSLCHLGVIQQHKSDLIGAENSFRRCLAIYEQRLGKDDPRVTVPLDNLGRIFGRRRDFATAELFYRRAIAIDKQTRGEDSPEFARHLNNLGTALLGKGQTDEAEVLWRQALDLMRHVNGPTHWETIDVMSNLARLFREKGDYAQARSMYEEVLALDRQYRGERHRMVGQDLASLANLAVLTGQHEEAERLYRDALSIYDATLPADDSFSLFALTELAKVLVLSDRPAEGEVLLQRALSGSEALAGRQSYQYALTHATLAWAWGRQGQWSKAAPALAMSYELLASKAPPGDKNVRLVQEWLKEARLKSDRQRQARK